MDSLETVAERFKIWAAEKGIFSYDPPEDRDDLRTDDISEIADTQDAVAATAVLQHKRINFVGVNPAENKIVICTHLKVSGKDLERLPLETTGGYEIEYIKSFPPTVKMPASGSVPAGTYAIHNGRYTCGSSISVGNCVAAGTLGCLVQDRAGVLLGLTNNHVTGGCGYTEASLPVVAPGLLDVRPTGCDPFTLGHHHSVAPWASGSPDNVNVADNLDAAVFRIKDGGLISSMQRSAYDTPSAVAAPAVGMMVEKVGRTTGHTHGMIIAKSVGYEPVQMQVPSFNGRIYFTDLYVVKGMNNQDFAKPGDSGSLICARQGNDGRVAVGLLFAVAGDRQLTFFSPLQKALDKFNVTLVCGYNT